MPTDETKDAPVKITCEYGTCPYYEHGEGQQQTLMRPPIQERPPCGNCYVKPEDAPDTSNPQEWRKIA